MVLLVVRSTIVDTATWKKLVPRHWVNLGFRHAERLDSRRLAVPRILVTIRFHVPNAMCAVSADRHCSPSYLMHLPSRFTLAQAKYLWSGYCSSYGTVTMVNVEENVTIFS